MHEDEAYLAKVVEIGAHGFILKNAEGSEIIKALQQIYQEERYFSPEAFNRIGTKQTDSSIFNEIEAVQRLTKRERQILVMIAEGMSTPDIAKKLFLSPRTVDTHRANIMQKLHIHQATGLVRFAIEKGLLK